MKTNLTTIIALTCSMLAISCQKELPEPVINDANLSEVADETDTEAGMERNLGCKMLSDALYNKLPKDDASLTIQSLPSSVSLAHPLVRNQGSEGSCVSFAVAYAARSIMKKYKTGATYSTSTNIFSPEYVHNQIKQSSDCSDGTYIVDALALLMGGVCTWSAMPYSSTNGCSQQPSSGVIGAAFFNRITAFSSTAPSVYNIKSKLADNRPVIVAGPVDANFDNLGYNQVLTQYNSATKRGDHAYCVIGYDDSKRAFKIMNSWGTSWATAGFGWISYDLISNIGVEYLPRNLVWKQAYVMSATY